MTTFSFEPEYVRGRLLMIEDASVFREMQSLLLRRAGYLVATCEQPHLALLEASHQPFEVAVLNSDAPGIDSPEFFAALRRHRPKIAIIFVAAALTVELTRELTRAGAAAVLQRPVNPTLLMEKIDFALGYTVQPGAPQLFAGGSPTASSAECTPNISTSVNAKPSESTPPFGGGSAAPFMPPQSNPPFRTYDSAAPFRMGSAPPFRPDSASPFSGASASPFVRAGVR